MKRLYFLSLIFFAVISFISNNNSFAQTLYFCEDVDADGYPVNESSVFSIPKDGGYLYTLVRLPYEVDCYSVRYEIYRNGDYDNTIYVDVEKDWTWFWKKITFNESGTYEFYAYDCDDNLLTSGEVKIKYY
ncbi:MAG: hypothetical protein Q7S39_03980 [Ignavibacteria bacterium]|nr:hypothetical protein [Ignavibacteria bacterium]